MSPTIVLAQTGASGFRVKLWCELHHLYSYTTCATYCTFQIATSLSMIKKRTRPQPRIREPSPEVLEEPLLAEEDDQLP